MAIKALELQPSEDCISRAYIEPIIEELENICVNGDEHILDLLADIKNAPSAQPERKNVWHKTYDEGFPAEAEQVLVTDGKYFWLDESIANDVGLMWEGDGSMCWERTEWAYFKDLRGEQNDQKCIIQTRNV